MENLELQTKVINLGKLLIQEFGDANYTDTLSQWMAHYIAEKFILSENASAGEEKTVADKDLFETILNLWEHRGLLPSGKRPFENFEPIFKVLEMLNPDKEKTFFNDISLNELSDIKHKNPDYKEIENFINTALEIDKVARIWIQHLLEQAAIKASDERTQEFLKNAITLKDNNDTAVIKILLDTNSSFTSKVCSEDDFEKKYQIEKHKLRIEELEKFGKLNEFILNCYKNELLEIDET